MAIASSAPTVKVPLGLTGATAATRYVGGTASGAPIAGTFAIGDFVIDQTGVTWVCTAAGSPGTWVSGQATGGVSNAGNTNIAAGNAGGAGNVNFSLQGNLVAYLNASNSGANFGTNLNMLGTNGGIGLGVDSGSTVSTKYRDGYLAYLDSSGTILYDIMYWQHPGNAAGKPSVNIGSNQPGSAVSQALLNIGLNQSGGVPVNPTQLTVMLVREPTQTGDVLLMTNQPDTTRTLRHTAIGDTLAGKNGSTSAVDGFTWVPAAAGPPTGTPTATTGGNAYPSGYVPLYYDKTNNKWYVYNVDSAAWKGVTLS